MLNVKNNLSLVLMKIALALVGSSSFSRLVKSVDRDHHYSVWHNEDVLAQIKDDMRDNEVVDQRELRDVLVCTLESMTQDINEQIKVVAYNHGLLAREHYPE